MKFLGWFFLSAIGWLFLFSLIVQDAQRSATRYNTTQLEGAPSRNCIQEVTQGRTLSREYGSLRRDARSGVWVCSRITR